MTIAAVVALPSDIPAYAALRDIIRTEILSGKLAAGSRLTTASLVERFGISQMPVREALQALEGEGLITIVPHKGATVLSLDAKRIGNIYDLRGTLEALLARSCLPNITNAAMAELCQLHEELKAFAARSDAEAVFGTNLLFHNLIYRHSENPEAKGVYDRFANLLRTLRGRYGFSGDRMDRMVAEHEGILLALRDQDVVRLEAVVRAHVDGAKEDLIMRIEDERAGLRRGNFPKRT